VIEAVSSVPSSVSRKQLVTYLTEEKDVSPFIANWMTTNFKHSNGKNASLGLEFNFDLNVVNSLVKDFEKQKYISKLKYICENASNNEVHIVRAGKNKSWNNEVLKVLETMDPNVLFVHELKKAGHFVHVDDLQGLVHLMTKFH